MLGYLTLILLCQLIGELIVGGIGLPLPGPVLGMLVLFAFLVIRKDTPATLEKTANSLLQSMSLLFVPAGTGIILHFRLLDEAALPISLALVVSTLLAITVTAFMMRWLGKAPPGE